MLIVYAVANGDGAVLLQITVMLEKDANLTVGEILILHLNLSAEGLEHVLTAHAVVLKENVEHLTCIVEMVVNLTVRFHLSVEVVSNVRMVHAVVLMEDAELVTSIADKVVNLTVGQFQSVGDLYNVQMALAVV